jgi:hypothetical protein
MLIIREAQMAVFRANARAQCRKQLYFRLSTRDLPFGLELLGTQVQIGLDEADRLQISGGAAISEFVETVVLQLGGFTVGAGGRVVYPAPAVRFLSAMRVPPRQRVQRFAQWAASRQAS